MQALQQEFEQMVCRIQNTPKNKNRDNASLAETLHLYALFKQSTIGDAHGTPPHLFRVEARAKYQAHKKLKGMSTPVAMQAYLNLVYRIEARANTP